VPVIVGGAANYTAALHLMRTGAAGVLVGFGGGAVSAYARHAGRRGALWPRR
jgi:IMP dehydrogenase